MTRASFRQSWLSIDTNLGSLNLQPFNAGLSVGQKAKYTLGLALLSLLFLVILDPYGAAVVFGVGVWVIWNRGSTITKGEKKIFATAVTTSVFLGFLEPVAVLLKLSILWLAMFVIALIWIWRD